MNGAFRARAINGQFNRLTASTWVLWFGLGS